MEQHQAAELHPSKLLGYQEASELASYNYMSGCMLDVELYCVGIEKLGEESEAQVSRWRELQQRYVSNLVRAHLSMQNSDVTFWEPPPLAIGRRGNRDWLERAVLGSIAHRRNLTTILGVPDEQICQVNVFPLYALGTAKKNNIDAIAKSLRELPGMTLVFSQ